MSQFNLILSHQLILINRGSVNLQSGAMSACRSMGCAVLISVLACVARDVR